MRARRSQPRGLRVRRTLWSAVVLAALAATVFLSACGSSSGSGGSGSSETTAVDTGNPRNCNALRLYTWEGLAPATLLKPFESKYGVPVKVSYITSPADALAKLAAGGTKQYDVIFNEAGVLKPSVEAGVIKPIDPSKFPEFHKLFKFVAQPFDVEGKYYGLPTVWGVNPFLYSTEVMSEAPTSWAALWSPKLKDQVSLWEDVSLLYVGAAVLGYDKEPEQLWNLSQEQLEAIRNKMLELKGNVRTMWNSGGDLIQLYANHEVGASMSWAYIYHELKKKGDPIAKANLPDMGAQGWAEAAEISSGISPDCEAAAYAFLREMNTPKGQALMAESSGYTPANPGAAKYLSKELNEQIGLNDPKAFRGSAIIKLAPADPEAYNQTLQEIISGLG